MYSDISDAQSSASLIGVGTLKFSSRPVSSVTRPSRVPSSVCKDGKKRWKGRRSALGFGGVVRARGADEGLERLLVDLVTFLEIDGAAHSAVKAGIEEACRIGKRRAARKGELHLVLV